MDNTTKQAFWKRVEKIAQDQGLSLSALSGKAGLKYQTLHKQQQEGRLPKLEEAAALSDVLGVTLEYLLTGSEKAIVLSPEAMAVNYDETLKAIVRYCTSDRELYFNLSILIRKRMQRKAGK